MKKIITLSIFAALLGLSVSAQQGRKKQDGSKYQHGQYDRQLLQDLNLDENQGQQIKAINQNIKTKRDAIRDDQSLSQTEKMDRLKTLQQERKTRFDAVLTTEQKQKIKANKEEQFGTSINNQDSILINNGEQVKQDKKIKKKFKQKGRK